MTHYIWGTEGDDRVRDSHAANEGHIFAWDNPPATGHPGEASNCRCSASPVKLPDDPPIEPVYPIESIILGGLACRIKNVTLCVSRGFICEIVCAETTPS